MICTASLSGGLLGEGVAAREATSVVSKLHGGGGGLEPEIKHVKARLSLNFVDLPR